MIWLSWRQFRAQAAVAAVGLVAIAILLAITGHGRAVANCGPDTRCLSTGTRFLGLSHIHLLQYLSTALLAVPALLGAFWGAPLLARELESGTYRLAWTQGVTRNRWLAVKLGLVGLASLIATGLFVLMLTKWSNAHTNLDRFSSAMFDERGIAPIGDAAFGFALGVTAGVLIRRTVPAMAATLAGFLAVRIVVANWLRPHFAAPLTLSAPASDQPGPGLVPPHAGAWVTSDRIVDSTGRAVNTVQTGCRLARGTSHAQARACLAHVHAYVAGLRQVITYQPASRYWTFQVYDVAVFLGAALVLVGFCFWWVRWRLN